MSNNAAPQSTQPIVARLRHLAKLLGFDLPVVLNEAADRIEEQEAALRDIVAAVPANVGGTQGAIRKRALAALQSSTPGESR